MRIVIAAAFAIATLAAPATAANLITNGDFGAGNSGFGSGYTYVSPGYGVLFPEGLYTVDTNPQTSHPYFYSFGDHTTGESNFMIVNGAGTPNTDVWSQTVAVTAGRTYKLSAFLSSVYPSSPALLDFFVTPGNGNRQLVFASTAPGSAAVWVGHNGNFTATSNSITLSIVNQNTVLGGNDFGIDDISLNAVPEPTSWAMLIAGFGLVGIAARRRRGHAITA